MIVNGTYVPDSMRALLPSLTPDKYPSTDLLSEVKELRHSTDDPAPVNRAQRRAQWRKS